LGLMYIWLNGSGQNVSLMSLTGLFGIFLTLMIH